MRLVVLLSVVLGIVGCNLYTDLDRPDPNASFDAGTDAQMGDTGGCIAQTDLEFCQNNGADCDEITAFDNCGASRTVNCGDCPAGVVCGEEAPNVCGCPCEIGGECYADGAINPDNACESCQPAVNPNTFSPRAEGETCQTGNRCVIAAECSAAGVCEPLQVVQCNDDLGDCAISVCDPTDGMCKPENLPDDTECTLDGITCTADVCSSGVCEHPVRNGFCFSDGECLGDGESPSENSCVTCSVDAGVATLMMENEGTMCAPDLSCATFACNANGQCIATVAAGECAIDGTCYADADTNTSNLCQFCDPAMSQTSWSSLSAGEFCRTPNCVCGDRNGTIDCLRPNDALCN